MGSTRDDDRAEHGAAAAALGWIGAGAVNLAASALFRDDVTAAASVRALGAFVELGRHVALGLVCAGVVWAWTRAGPRARWARLAALALASLGLGLFVMYADAAGFAGRTAEATGLPQGLLHVGFVAAASQAVPLAWLGIRWLASKPSGWIAGLGGAAAVYWLNADLWQQDNPGLHFWMSCTVATTLAAVIVDRLGQLPERVAARPPALDRAGLALLAIWAAYATLAPPSNKVKVHLAGWSPNLLALSVSVGDSLDAGGDEDAPPRREFISPEQRAFFEDRDAAPAVPPTQPPLVEAPPVVILLTVDALRHDLLDAPDTAKFVPVLQSLHERGVSFDSARAPGSQTVYSLSSMSTSRYFSQMYWKRYERQDWLHDDESIHFAAKLGEAGVTTVIVPGAVWFEADYGILRGFAEGEYQQTDQKWTHAENLTTRINEALVAHHQGGPLFIYCHYLDPHKPYDSGKITEGPHFQRYLSELEMVDEQIGRVVDEITRLGIWDRTLLIVSSDHGEAFNEHGVKKGHAVNLYDELLLVPMVARGLGLERRELSEPVSLIDLGPTILDIFGVDTPGVFMGQSLVPLLRGEQVELSRPIVAEGRLKRSMVFRSGLKLIVDYKLDTVELYDLERDPGELDNLADGVDLSTSDEYRALREFFEVHTFDGVEGYVVPERR